MEHDWLKRRLRGTSASGRKPQRSNINSVDCLQGGTCNRGALRVVCMSNREMNRPIYTALKDVRDRTPGDPIFDSITIAANICPSVQVNALEMMELPIRESR